MHSCEPCLPCCSRPEAVARTCVPRPQLPPWGAAPAGVRTLYLVRHGAYDIDDPRDEAVGQGLLPIGVAQARLAGDRLRGLPFTFDAIVASPLTRARETARSDRRRAARQSRRPEVWLRSRSRRVHAADPARRHHGEGEAGGPRRLQRAARAPRGTAARRRRRRRGGDRRELVVAHGNVIRWLVTRALGGRSRGLARHVDRSRQHHGALDRRQGHGARPRRRRRRPSLARAADRRLRQSRELGSEVSADAAVRPGRLRRHRRRRRRDRRQPLAPPRSS